MSGLIRFGESAFPHLVDVVWQVTALIAVFFVVARLLRRRSLTSRYWLWVYCLVGMLLLPGVSFLVRDQRLALLPAKEHTVVARPASEPAPLVSHVVDSTPMAEMTDTFPPSEETRTPPPAEKPSEEPPSSEVAAPKGVVAASGTDLAHKSQPIVSAPISGTESPFPWRGCTALAWMAGCTVFLLRLVFAMVCIIRLRRSARPVEDSLVAESFEEVKGKAGISRRVALRTGKRVSSPVSIGIFRPTILLPESLVHEMPPEQLRPILLHELAHIRWGDYAVNLLQRLAQAVFFFHPLVYLVNRALRGLREEICDGWVLRHCPEATLYARALTTLAERWLRPRRSLLGVGLFNHHSRLSERIKRILGSEGRVPTAFRLRTALLLLSVSLSAVAALSLTTLSAKAAKEEEKSAQPKKEPTEAVEEVAGEDAVSWKGDTVYRDGKAYAKIVQWEPEADLPMTAFGDQNDNGETDTWIRFLNGKPLRIEIDSNEDGRIDRWEHYFDGVIDLVEKDTDFNRRVDLWEVYDNGKLFRKEIDENADGSVDKWLEVDEQGKLVEKEIFSWTVRGSLETRTDPAGGRDYRRADATFFNAAGRVEKTELKPRSETPASSSRGPSMAVPNPPDQPRFRLRPLTGCRVEYTKEVDGNKVVAGWFHESVPREAGPSHVPWERSIPVRPQLYFNTVRHLAVDVGFDGGVDCWGLVGPPIADVPPESADARQPTVSFELRGDLAIVLPGRRGGSDLLFSALSDDTNRDGKADRVYIELGQDANTRRLGERFARRIQMATVSWTGLAGSRGGHSALTLTTMASSNPLTHSGDLARSLKQLARRPCGSNSASRVDCNLRHCSAR